jgi:hypothetical protein
MGVISHFVGDGSQPLHITRHHHGWVGPNPKGYTMEPSFHAYIDGGVIDLHNITKESLVPRARPPRPVSTKTYWPEICAYLEDTFKLMEPLYELEKTGDLERSAGKAFIEDRLLEGGAMLAGVWVAAYNGAHIDDYRVRQLTLKAPTTQKIGSTSPYSLRRSSSRSSSPVSCSLLVVGLVAFTLTSGRPGTGGPTLSH